MDVFNIIVTVFQLIFYVTAIILAIYLISSLKRITGSVEKIESEVVKTSTTVSAFVTDASAFVTDANLVLNDIKEVSGELKVKIRKIESLSDAVVEKGYEVLNAIDTVQEFSSNYANKGLRIISGISSGVKEFFHKLKRPFLELKSSSETNTHSIISTIQN